MGHRVEESQPSKDGEIETQLLKKDNAPKIPRSDMENVKKDVEKEKEESVEDDKPSTDEVVDDLTQQFSKTVALEPQEGEDNEESSGSNDEDDLCGLTENLQLSDEDDDENEDENQANASSKNVEPSLNDCHDAKSTAEKVLAEKSVGLIGRSPVNGIMTQPTYQPQLPVRLHNFEVESLCGQEIPVSVMPPANSYIAQQLNIINASMKRGNDDGVVRDQPGVKYMTPEPVKQPVEHDETIETTAEQHQQQANALHQHQQALQQHQMQHQPQQRRTFRTNSSSGMSGGVATETQQDSMPEKMAEEMARLQTVLSSKDDLPSAQQPAIQVTSEMPWIPQNSSMRPMKSGKRHLATSHNAAQQPIMSTHQQQQPLNGMNLPPDLLDNPPSPEEMSVYIKEHIETSGFTTQQQPQQMVQQGSPQAMSPYQQAYSPQQSYSPAQQQVMSPAQQQVMSPAQQQVMSPAQQVYSPAQSQVMSPQQPQGYSSPVHQQAMSPVHPQVMSPAQQQRMSPRQQQVQQIPNQQPLQQALSTGQLQQAYSPAQAQRRYSPPFTSQQQVLNIQQGPQMMVNTQPSNVMTSKAFLQQPSNQQVQNLQTSQQFQQNQNIPSHMLNQPQLPNQYQMTGQELATVSACYEQIQQTLEPALPYNGDEPPRLSHFPEDSSSNRDSISPFSSYSDSVFSQASESDQVSPDSINPLAKIPELEEADELIDKLLTPHQRDRFFSESSKEELDLLGDFLEDQTFDRIENPTPNSVSIIQTLTEPVVENDGKRNSSNIRAAPRPNDVPTTTSNEALINNEVQKRIQALRPILPATELTQEARRPNQVAKPNAPVARRVESRPKPTIQANDVQQPPSSQPPAINFQEEPDEAIGANSYVSNLKEEEFTFHDDDRWSLLHIGIDQQKFYLVKAMLSRLKRKPGQLEEFINEKTADSKTPLYLALQSLPEEGAKDMKIPIIWTLLDHGANVMIPCCHGQTNSGLETVYQSALHLAASMCRADILRLLLWSNTVDVNAQNTAQETPVHCAIKRHGKKFEGKLRDCREVLTVLAEHGANFAAKAKANKTVFHNIAESKWDESLLAHLLALIPTASRAKILAEGDDGGNTVLHLLLGWSARLNKDRTMTTLKSMLKVFLEAGADPRLKDHRHRTAQQFAKNDELLEMLKKPSTSGRQRGSRHSNSTNHHRNQPVPIQPMIAPPQQPNQLPQQPYPYSDTQGFDINATMVQQGMMGQYGNHGNVMNIQQFQQMAAQQQMAPPLQQQQQQQPIVNPNQYPQPSW